MGKNIFVLLGVSLLLSSAFSTIIITSQIPKMVQLGKGRVGIILDDDDDDDKGVSSTTAVSSSLNNGNQVRKYVADDSTDSTVGDIVTKFSDGSFFAHSEPRIPGGTETIDTKTQIYDSNSKQDSGMTSNTDTSILGGQLSGSSEPNLLGFASKQSKIFALNKVASSPSTTSTTTTTSVPQVGFSQPINPTTPTLGLANPTVSTSSLTSSDAPTYELPNPISSPTVTSQSLTPTPVLGLADPTPTPSLTTTSPMLGIPNPYISSVETTPVLTQSTPVLTSSTPVFTSTSFESPTISYQPASLSTENTFATSPSDIWQNQELASLLGQGNEVATTQVSNGVGNADIKKLSKALGVKLTKARNLVEVNKVGKFSSTVA